MRFAPRLRVGSRWGGVEDLAGGVEHLGAVGVGGEAFDDAVMDVLAVGQRGQAVEDRHVELLLGGEAGQGGALGGQELGVPTK